MFNFFRSFVKKKSRRGQGAESKPAEMIVQEDKGPQGASVSQFGPCDGFQGLPGTGSSMHSKSSYMREILTQEEYDALYIDILKPLSMLELILVRSKCQCYDLHEIPANLIDNNSLESYVSWKQFSLTKVN